MPPSSSRQAGSLSLLTAHLSPLLLCCLLLFVQCSKHTAEKPPAAATSPYPPWYKPPNERGKVETMDINGDGVQDTIQSDNSSGSGFGSELKRLSSRRYKPSDAGGSSENSRCLCHWPFEPTNRLKPPTPVWPRHNLHASFISWYADS